MEIYWAIVRMEQDDIDDGVLQVCLQSDDGILQVCPHKLCPITCDYEQLILVGPINY